MQIIARALALSASPSTLLAILLVCCHCVCTTVHARSLHHSKTTSSDDSTELVASCDLIRPFFDSKNITLVPAGDHLPKTCHGKCCGEEMEDRLKQQARTDFHNLIHHHSRSLQGLLVTTADALRETVIVLLRKSENKTLFMFDKVYQSMAVLSRPSIRSLYQAMVDYVSSANTSDDLQQPLTRDTLQERFREFFARLFPIAYHYLVDPDQNRGDFTEKFKSCLHETMDDIQPFSDVPQDIFKKISKSLEATRVLVQALSLGKTFLERTDSVLFAAEGANSPQQKACYNALVRMTYCPKCKGIGKDVRSCNGFCMNVIRGCLTEPAYELDNAWSGYVATVGRLIAAVDNDNNPLELNIKIAVRELDSRISDAIMRAMENGPDLQQKVRKVCGRSELLPPNEENPASSTAAAKLSESPGEMHAAASSLSSSSLTFRAYDDLLEGLRKQIGNFVASFETSRYFYTNMADTICEEYPRKHCWNGERIGEYAKTVVDSSPNSQRYNPELALPMTSSTPVSYTGNTNISALSDQLRHINQLVQTQLASSPDAGVFLADEAMDGSGSGDRPVWPHGNREIDDDEDGHDDDHDDDEASGSGMGPTTSDPSTKTNQNGPNSGSRSSILLSIVLAVVCASLIA
ncbi:division abnormally delayed protein [Nylanderia fulva]|uniref:division abnormally delayed protein n=1 Tax=Nylanderia fulva TaxID=613905 RepID=UPI0010FAD307|nr:division abnormally delayed protein [Nylanderia fulva]